MPYDHDNEYEYSTDSNDSDYFDECENNLLPECPKCGEGRLEDEINNFHGMCYDCIEDLREKKEMDEK
jgi:uncharacterized protein (DUF983 family)